MHNRHQGDPGRTYLTGFSFGGNGVFDLALKDPSAWRSLWPVDQTRVPEGDPGLPVWLSPPGVEPDDRIYMDAGLDHVGTADSAYRNTRIYEWLLARAGA